MLLLMFSLLPPFPWASAQSERGATANHGTASLSLEILTPTDGVDFTMYSKQLYGRVRKNWFATMPEALVKGEKGRVIVRFRILADGTLADKQLLVESATGSEPLRRAAVAAVKASSPFERYPEALKEPYIDVRSIFLYNLPLSAAKG